MRLTEIEGWALRMLDRKESGAQFEDDRVEHKERWPDDYPKIARRIAALCNAARGEPVLLIIGPEPERPESQGQNSATDPAEWFSKVESCFEAIAPDHQHIAISHNGRQADAILFHTDRAPYVVRNPLFGGKGQVVQLEVPWRDGTKTRSARREDLIRMLIPASKVPTIEIEKAEGWMTVKDGDDGLITARFLVNFLVYILPSTLDPQYLVPYTDSIDASSQPTDVFTIESLDFGGIVPLGSGTLIPTYSQEENVSRTIVVGTHELLIHGPGFAFITVGGSLQTDRTPTTIDLSASLIVAPGRHVVPINTSIESLPNDDPKKFSFKLAAQTSGDSS